MCTSTYIFAPRVITIATPQHASEPAPVLKQRFIEMLTTNRAAQLAIRDAALGKCVLHLQPSRNPHANQVFGAVLDAMVAYHMDVATKPEGAPPAGDATGSDEPPTEGQPEPTGPAPDGGQRTEEMKAQIEAAFAFA